MNFRIADTFADSLARLTGHEQKAVKTTAFDLQMDPANPGMRFHKLDKSRDKNFWSVRVSRDIRLIVHRTSRSLMLCYVGHHDDAYHWAERRKLETHPKTGAAQWVEVRKTVRNIAVPAYVSAEESLSAKPGLSENITDGELLEYGVGEESFSAKPRLFEDIADGELLGYGVPEEWLAHVRAADEDNLLDLIEHLPGEAAEALLELATGGQPRPVAAPEADADPFDHPDARRRFRTLDSVDELTRALEFPWEKWTIFLHPDQHQQIERDYSGPARVSGSAGTGKTVVALHRAVYLARTHPDARVLLGTFSDTLASALGVKLRRLIQHEPVLAERIDVYSFDALALRLHKARLGPVQLVGNEKLRELLSAAAAQVEDHRFSEHFLLGEWDQVVDAWQLNTWEAYRDVVRLGRKTRLPEAQRRTLWAIFERVRAALDAAGLMTRAGVFAALAAGFKTVGKPPFDFAVIDEAQDVSVSQLRFLAALGADRPNALFFAGDLGQRIFQQPFSWQSLGVDIRGRSRTLRVNYRTSHQIRSQADRLLGAEIADVDGNLEDRRGTVSVFNGPPPQVRLLADAMAETNAVAAWLTAQVKDGIAPDELALFVRSRAQIARADVAARSADIPYKILDEQVRTEPGRLSIATMHLAKGLEFRAVAVLACDDEVLPLQERIEAVGDTADLQDTYDTERHLLYVACTRARDRLLVTGVEPGSEFLADMRD